jgi:hypothetical protein
MTLAEKCLDRLSNARQTLSVPRAVVLTDPSAELDEMDESIHVYYFADGSKLGTRGRGKNHQRWVIPS